MANPRAFSRESISLGMRYLATASLARIRRAVSNLGKFSPVRVNREVFNHEKASRVKSNRVEAIPVRAIGNPAEVNRAADRGEIAPAGQRQTLKLRPS
jgi:hypothetical protein